MATTEKPEEIKIQSITEVREIIIRWMGNCTRYDQIINLAQTGPQIIDTLFSKTESPLVVDLAKMSITHAAEIQIKFIKKQSHASSVY